MTWNTLKEEIAKVIKTNGNQEITGQLLQDMLINIVNSIGKNATFAGIAIPTTNPGAHDGFVFYIVLSSGNYSYFDNIVVTDSEIGIIFNNSQGSWLYRRLLAIDSKLNDNSVNAIQNKAVSFALKANKAETNAALETKADKAETNAALETKADKAEVDKKIKEAVASVYKIKGSVTSFDKLPTIDVIIGDVYNVLDTGANYVAINNNPIEWDKLSETVDLSNIQNELANKVDKVTGKQLSTNDFTTAEKQKLITIQAHAQKNVQSDWDATEGDSFIKNKPTIPTLDNYYNKQEVDSKLGDINTILDSINGEVI